MFKILLALFSIISLFANEKVTIQLNWKYQFEFAGFIMAQEKGFYKEAGLNVKLKELDRNSENIVKWVNQKDARYGVGNSALFAKIIDGNPVELLMPIYDKSPLILTAVNLPSVKTLKDLENQKVIVGQLALQEPAILAMLKSQNVNLKNVNFKHENFYEHITQPAVYAFYSSNELYTLEKKHIPFKVFDPQKYGFNFYGDILFTSQSEAIYNPTRAKKIMEATKKGYIYAFNHIDETIDVILKKYNTQHFTKEKLKFEAKVLKSYLSKSFTFDRSTLSTIKNIYVLLGKKPVNFEDFVFKYFKLNKIEQKFLNTHIIKAISTAQWEPFNLLKNGKLEGIAIDYWKYIKQETHMKSKCLIATKWVDVLKNIKNKTADVTCSTTITPDRKKYAIFSKPYVSFPIVLATRNDIGFISDMSLLKGKVIAVGKNYTAEKLLIKHYPDIKLLEVRNTDEALRLVSEGRVYGAVDILPVIAYKINKYEYVNLKISGKTNFNFNVRFMIRKDYPELLSIINKMIDAMPEEKRSEIYRKWVSVKLEKGYSRNYVDKIYTTIGIALFFIFIFILYLWRNISLKSKKEEEFRTLATMDKLTSIFNRYKIDMALDEQIEIAKRYKRPLSLIFFDIDHFKRINDRYGHKIGDYVLIEIAKLINGHIRSSDIFGRWGGEEFLIILPETDIEKATLLAKKLRKEIENHKFEYVDRITCSFGVTTYKEDDSVNAIMERVDKLLYQSKENGRNQVTIE
jgi:polar amino acid transport system substrate-binding protein